MELLSLNHVNITYKVNDKRIYAVDDLTLSVEPGKSIGIVGESGSGKSTLALGILRLLHKDVAETTGEIIFQGKNLLTCGEAELRELRWEQMAVVFQKSMNALSPVHKIGNQLTDIYRVHDTVLSKKEIKNKILKLFDMVNLSARVFDMYPHELSGGMMQRVSIATSLLHEPPFLILDEATTALDVITQGQILTEIKRLKQQLNVTWMLITHDISVVVSSCDKIAVMYAGRLMEYGDVNQVISHPAHPYTRGLLKSFPSLRGERTNLKGMEGALPDLSLRYKGCIFAPRCPLAQNQCFYQKPPMIDRGSDHLASCFFCGGDKD